MLNKFQSLWLALMASLILLQACEEPKAAKPVVKKFFDLEGFLDSQASYLNQMPVKVRKKVVINGEPESQQLQRLDWEKEFAFFNEADINKPAWRNSFTSDSIIDSKTGIKTVIHKATEEDVNVDWLKLNYVMPENRLQSIEAKVGGSNMLYASGRLMRINCFQDANDSLRIKSYDLKGYQKLILQDSVTFVVNAELDYKQTAK